MSTRRIKLPDDRLFKINLSSYEQLRPSSGVDEVDIGDSYSYSYSIRPQRTSATENEFLLKNLNPEEAEGSDPASKLPDFDNGRLTKVACTWGLVLVWLVIIACITIGVLCVIRGPNGTCMGLTGLSIGGGEALSLGVNVLLTLCIEALGYIHGTSLRWALFHDGRLQYNTNTRLFSCARSSQNGWLSNCICTASLILCYAASSQLFVYGATWPKSSSRAVWGVYANGVAFLMLALGLLGKAVIATWILLSETRKNILTWSSNPLNTTLAVIHRGLEPRSNRCMLSVHQAELPSIPIVPLRKQQSIRATHRSILYIALFAWLLPILASAFFLVLIIHSKTTFTNNSSNPSDPRTWHFTFSWSQIGVGVTQLLNTLVLHMKPSRNQTAAPILLAGLMILSLVQAAQTLSLHAIELIVNLSRDEDSWRAAALKKRGARLSSEPFTSATLSWQSLVLFVAKAGLHWLLGQSVLVGFRNLTDTDDSSFYLNWYFGYIRALAYVVGTIVLAIFTTYLAYRRLGGSQPASFGHLQTLADLVDDWSTDGNGRFWWGDKGEVRGVRHAGMSCRREELEEVRRDRFYAG
ncbi:uncharacterized protein PAC_04625 [Phialocephala subalpina]|uniref:Uncharacterized protein n=1 Tax=Phialocephala subalpina TaxID=576137 RepID=A0A1L7WPT5_9HELO|nr:uncharacterized protein PAC_04625 [Phialocephala subalpina]